MTAPLEIVIVGLSITSSWGNGHATTYRGLVRELVARGHHVTFLERDVPWYAGNRDMPSPPFGRTELYASIDELKSRHGATIESADLVILGSFVPDGIEAGRFITHIAGGVTAFYDIDTPITMARLASGDAEYVSRELVSRFDLYLSFSGGPTLQLLEQRYGAQRARAFYCSVDPARYHPVACANRWTLGYMGTYSDDRQPTVDRLLLEPASRMNNEQFVVAGPQYPDSLSWPPNVERLEHVAPDAHSAFYSAQRWTLNVTRRDMVVAGWSPSVRLFEAAACGVPIISDAWPGLEDFFRIGEEIFVAHSSDEIVQILNETPEHERERVAERARAAVLASHTAAHRARELEQLVRPLMRNAQPA